MADSSAVFKGGSNLALAGVNAVLRRASANPSFVMVVADNPETLETLDSYFTRVGVTSVGTNQLGDASGVPSSASALVLFPDDFQHGAVESFIVAVRRSRPHLLVLLVSAAPQLFGAAVGPDGHSLLPVVLPKPAFGWTILDAIRNRPKEQEAD